MDGARSRGQDPDLATQLFDLMEKFAEYGFNKSHTAAYAVVTYQTAWLKAHYPAEFMAATLSSDMDDTDKVQLFVRDAQANGVTVMIPDINRSGFRFEPQDAKTIRYGLGAVKGTGQAAVENILAVRSAGGPFADLYDFCDRIDRKQVNRRAVEALVRAGAFDAVDEDRARLLANVQRAMDAAEQNERARRAGQGGLFGDFGDVGAAVAPAGAGPAAPVREWIAAAPWDEHRRLHEEKTALGYFLSGHLFTVHESEIRRFVRTRLADLARIAESGFGSTPVTVAGIVASVTSSMTRRGRMMRVVLDDRSATEELAVFSEAYEQHRHLLKEDELVIVHGKVSKDEYSGGYRFGAERILDLGTARGESARALKLRMNGESSAARLRTVLGPFKIDGSQGAGCPVEIEYHNGSAAVSMRLGPDWVVKPEDALLAQLKDWLSADGVQLVYR